MDDLDDRLSFLEPPLPPGFRVRVVALAPGEELLYREEDWRDAMVVVERGNVFLICLRGGRRRFRAGDLLWLLGLPLHAVANPGPDEATLLAVSRSGVGSEAHD